MSGASVRLSVWAVCAAGCGVEWFELDADPAPADDSGDVGDEPGADACALASAHADACAPEALSDLSISVTGLPWPEPGPYIGIADCTVAALGPMPGMTTIELGCVHAQGDPIEPVVTLTIVADDVDVASALHAGRPVRLVAAATLADEDVPGNLYIKLARPGDDALLLAATEGWGRVAPSDALLAEVGLSPADWYAPLAVALVGGACTAGPAPCAGTRERAAVSFAAAGRDPAAILGRREGTIDGGYRAWIGAAELYSDPLDCVDNQPRSDLVVVAAEGCPR